jgi:hypothetical protein
VEPIEPIRRRRRTVLPIPALAKRRAPDPYDPAEAEERRERQPRRAPQRREPEPPGDGHVDVHA